ncbi:hypothetical protein AJ87_00530 [Rhizobium yanglingense]|nr:hypothetical protein AJ87_00530 [Rhizobium yanglingense]
MPGEADRALAFQGVLHARFDRDDQSDFLVGQQCSGCSAAGEAHLFLNSETQILHQMKAIRHLRCLRRTFTSSLRVKPASISAYHLNRRVLLQPSCNAYHAAVLENVQDLSAFKIDNDRAVAP